MTSNETEANYAFWTSPDQKLTVHYSLEQFHEIDFQVNEGYRRIPHGGIEVGGLLWGRLEPAGVRISAFRQIECEHSTGPSFNLSERDIDNLQKQIESPAADPDLAGLEVVGWFIAHTRTPLRMNDREAALFDRFFAKKNQITVLVKPERFQPTRFGFISRKADGSFESDASQSAIILPLPGRAGRGSSGPIPSIPAPPDKPAVAVTAPKEAVAEPQAPAVEPPPPPPTVQAPRPPRGKVQRPVSAEVPSPPPPDIPSPPPLDVPPASAPRHNITRVRTNGNPVEEPVESPARATEPASSTALVTATSKPDKLPSMADIRRRRAEDHAGDESPEERPRSYTARLLAILFVAAVLGCGVGYWGYRQLPGPVISLRILPDAAGLVVTWPVEQTRESPYAAIRVNDGVQQPLSPEEKNAGAARIDPAYSSNVKVELIVQHWMRDSRGIIRYVRSPILSVPGQTPSEAAH